LTEFYDEIDHAEKRRTPNSRHLTKKKTRHPVRVIVLSVLGLVVVAAVTAGVYGYGLGSSFNNSTQKIESAFPKRVCAPCSKVGKWEARAGEYPADGQRQPGRLA
jgi:hypothetical protein